MSNWTDIAPEVAAERNDGHRQTLILTFPVDIKAIDRNKIEVELHTGPNPFTKEFCDSVVKEMGTRPGEAFLDQMIDELARKSLIAGIR